MSEVVIVAAKRTPMGAFQGSLASFKGTDLGAAAIQAALSQSGLQNQEIDEVFMGNVLSAGLGQAPARQAAIKGGIHNQTPCTTVNKVCGSGLKAVMLGCDQIRLGVAKAIVAGGMESMTNAPYLLEKARGGLRLGHGQVIDHMFFDGLEDAYQKGTLMGLFAEETAAKYGFTREAQDAFTLNSLAKARNAMASGAFDDEIIALSPPKAEIVNQDESPLKAKPEKIPTLKPAFREGGTVTAANSSSISDGAAAVMLMSADEAKAKGIKPLARVLGYASHAHEPQWFTTAPVGAMEKLCATLGCVAKDIDLFEINEAFAVVTMAAIHDLGIDEMRVNIHGGACALGHPIGASGARLLVTLVHALKKHQARRGIVSLCIGGGEAVAMAIENLA